MKTLILESMHTDALIQSGLTKDQALVYEVLLSSGKVAASKLAQKTPLSRPLVYKVLADLIELDLVEKTEEVGAVARFAATHPFKLRDIIDRKREEVEMGHAALESVMAKLISEYTALSGKPGIRVLDGIPGIRELYEDILNEGAPLRLIRSTYDNHHPELRDIVAEQIKEQAKANITVRAITPFTDETREELVSFDKQALVTRHLVWMKDLNTPAQIILYGKKVAITSFGTEMVTTIIENEAIATTFGMLFEFIWNATEAAHREIYEGLMNGSISAPGNPWQAPQTSP